MRRRAFCSARRWSAGDPEPIEISVRLTIVQYGDYAEAALRFRDGGDADYYAQRYTVDFLGHLAGSEGVEQVMVISFAADRPEEVTATGVRSAGIGLYPAGRSARFAELSKMIAASRPTHLVVAAPIRPAIRLGLRMGIPVLPLFADSFRGRGPRHYLRRRLLARVLNHPGIDLVANHNLTASLDLARIGVSREKIVPFDWPELDGRSADPSKTAPPPGRPFRMLYVGQLTETKGVGDAVRALSILRRRGQDVRLTLVGRGDVGAFVEMARQAGVSGDLEVKG